LKLRISNWSFRGKLSESDLRQSCVQLKGVQMTAPRSLKILKESIDKRRGVRYVYTLEVDLHENVDIEQLRAKNKGLHFKEITEEIPKAFLEQDSLNDQSYVIVGAGPAGMFCAYTLALSGAKVTLLERGDDVGRRLKKVRALFKEGELDGESNICFGEGGAGTFSDGKLTTRKNHPWIREVFDALIHFGAPPEIATAGKPHIGTDRLRAVVVNMRKALETLGVKVIFNAKVDKLSLENNLLKQVHCGEQTYDTPNGVIWATGHSARDSFQLLLDLDLPMQAKPFAVGVRIEHPQSLVNKWLNRGREDLDAADYSVVCNISKERSVYSFCMCPGGQIVCSSSHDGYHVVNGMSNYARNSAFANSGLVVKVSEKDFETTGPLAGMAYQSEIESKAYAATGSKYLGPAQRVSDFFKNRVSDDLPDTSFKPGLVPVNLKTILPKPLSQSLENALLEFEEKYPGFAGEEALLIGTETRTSSPVSIPREENAATDKIKNLFPCGEGAGFAGGIVSAALDGLYVANCIRKSNT